MNMKNLALTVLAVSTAVFAGNSTAANNATAQATATVIAPIAITSSANLVFGSFAPGAGGSVTVSTDGTRTATGAVLSAINSAPSAAKFDVTGDVGATYSITFAPLAELTDGTNTMAIATFSDLTAAGATTGNVATGTLAGGAQSIYVGGTLTVDAAQVASTGYAGTIDVTVEYN